MSTDLMKLNCVSRGKDLLWTILPNETKAYWIARMWSVEWELSTSRLRGYIISPSRYCPGSDLLRQAWVNLNRLHTEVRGFNSDMWRWSLSKSPACNCGADQQTSRQQITSSPSAPLSSTKWSSWLDWCWYRCSKLLSGWLLSKFQRSNYFFWLFGVTCKKKKEVSTWVVIAQGTVFMDTPGSTCISIFIKGFYLTSLSKAFHDTK